jgi:Kelch motif protein
MHSQLRAAAAVRTTSVAVVLVALLDLGTAQPVQASGAWKTLAPLPVAVCGLSAATDQLGYVYALGGGCFGDNTNLVQRYSPLTNIRKLVAPMPTARVS